VNWKINIWVEIGLCSNLLVTAMRIMGLDSRGFAVSSVRLEQVLMLCEKGNLGNML
jgi:hypothetical protein